MEFSKHSLEILPPDWTGYLDPSSFLALQCAHVSSFSEAQCIESFWCNLCRNQLRSWNLASGPPEDIHLDANSIKHSLTRRGGNDFKDLNLAKDLTKYERQRLWSKAYRELTYDLRQPASALAATSQPFRPSGSLWMTAGNELRNDISHFKFPALLDEGAQNEEQITSLLNEIQLKKDAFNRFTSFCLLAPLGGDRCVMAKLPLPRLGVATVFPAATGGWELAWRPCSYYEVKIEAIKASEKPTLAARSPAFPRHTVRSECVSVGLALATIPLRGICRQQAGWNHSSWALHGDDGQLYHSHGRGASFRPLKNFVLQGTPDTEQPELDSPVIDLTKDDLPGPGTAGANTARRQVPRFGPGDVVGCGVAKFRNSFGIFFTLNGHFLGVAFQFRSFAEPRLWPLVGIDATWEVAMNFGSRPFSFNVSQVIQELPGINPQCHSLSSLLTEYPPTRWPGEAFETSHSESEDSEASGTLAHGSRWSDDTETESSDTENHILE